VKQRIETVREFVARGGVIKHVDFSRAYEKKEWIKKKTPPDAELKIQTKKAGDK
jgi:hypothetical protein